MTTDLGTAKTFVQDGRLQPTCIPQLVEMMNSTSESLARVLIFKALKVEPDKNTLRLFIKHGGWKAISELLKIFVEARDDATTTMVLQVIDALPLQIEDLKATDAPKLVRKLSVKAENADVRSSATTVYHKLAAMVGVTKAPAAAASDAKKPAPAPAAAPSAAKPAVTVTTTTRTLPATVTSTSSSSTATGGAAATVTKRKVDSSAAESAFTSALSSALSSSEPAKKKALIAPVKPPTRPKVVLEDDDTKATEKRAKILQKAHEEELKGNVNVSTATLRRSSADAPDTKPYVPPPASSMAAMLAHSAPSSSSSSSSSSSLFTSASAAAAASMADPLDAFLPRKKTVRWRPDLCEVKEYELQEGEREGKRMNFDSASQGTASFGDMEAREHKAEKEAKNRLRHPAASVSWPHLQVLAQDEKMRFVRGLDSTERETQRIFHSHAEPCMVRLDSPREAPDMYAPLSLPRPAIIPLYDLSQQQQQQHLAQPSYLQQQQQQSAYYAPAASGSGADGGGGGYTPGLIFEDTRPAAPASNATEVLKDIFSFIKPSSAREQDLSSSPPQAYYSPRQLTPEDIGETYRAPQSSTAPAPAVYSGGGGSSSSGSMRGAYDDRDRYPSSREYDRRDYDSYDRGHRETRERSPLRSVRRGSSPPPYHGSSSSSANSGGGGGGGAPAPRPSTGSSAVYDVRKTRMCHFYETPQGCKRGANCPYIHAASSSSR